MKKRRFVVRGFFPLIEKPNGKVASPTHNKTGAMALLFATAEQAEDVLIEAAIQGFKGRVVKATATIEVEDQGEGKTL